MDFEDLRVDCLNVLSQHSHGENREKYTKPQSGYLMTQPYCQGVKVSMYLSIMSVRSHNVCTRAVQKVSDLNLFRLNKSSTGSFLHCGCVRDIYVHA